MGMIGTSEARSSPCGTFISSTMMVMITAITPSVNASSRALFIAALPRGERSSELPQLLAEMIALEQRDEARGGVVDSLDDRFAVLELALGEAPGKPRE